MQHLYCSPDFGPIRNKQSLVNSDHDCCLISYILKQFSVKYYSIWPCIFGEIFYSLANQEQESSMATMFLSDQTKKYGTLTKNLAQMLPVKYCSIQPSSFRGLRRIYIYVSANQNQEPFVATTIYDQLGQNEELNQSPSKDAFFQILFHLAKQFQGR